MKYSLLSLTRDIILIWVKEIINNAALYFENSSPYQNKSLEIKFYTFKCLDLIKYVSLNSCINDKLTFIKQNSKIIDINLPNKLNINIETIINLNVHLYKLQSIYLHLSIYF